MQKKASKFIYWTPRIASIFFVLFLMLFSLDVFSNGLSFWETVLALFIHNIPALILLVFVIISWKHELVGAIAFVLAGLLYIVALLMNPKFEWYLLAWAIQFSGTAFVIGFLYYLNWKRKKK